MEIHILIIVDDATAQYTLIQYLKDLGYHHITIANSGDDALRKIESEDISLVFLDLQIKGTKDGIEIGEIIHKQFDHLILFYLTASLDQSSLQRALTTKPFHIIYKPYSIEVIKETINNAMNQMQSIKINGPSNSNHMLDKIFETVNTGICVTDIEGKFIKVNPAYCEIFGYTQQELIGNHFTLVLHESIRKYAANLHFEFISGLTEENEGKWKVVDKQGNEKEVHASSSRMIIETGKRFKVTTVTDITKREREVNKLAKALHEKDSFIQELLHRVKNNLNMISGLLFLQAEKLREKTDIYRLFQENIHRIKTVSIIHEQLYNQASFSEIDLKDYITALSKNLQSTYASAENITILLYIDDVKLHIDTAVTCGLIINEALSNSLKHAFEPGQAGEVNLIISSEGQKLNIKICDNGKGLPPHFNLENSQTLGMQLMKTLSGQLNGKLYVNDEQGTVINLSFHI